MAWRDWFRRGPAPEEKHAASEVVAYQIENWQANRERPQPTDFRKLADEGYRRNLIIFACVRELAQTAAEPDLVCSEVAADDETTKLSQNHPMVRLLNKPNPEQGQFAFLELLMTHLNVAGNAYVHKVRNAMGRVIQLWLLRPDRVEIVPGEDGHVRWYAFKVGTKKQRIEARDVIHLKYPDPLDDYYGLSPICAAARAGDLDNNMVDYLSAFFLNGAEPRGLLKFKVRTKPDDRERVKAMWKENHGGPRGWHDIGVVDSDVDFEAIGKGPGDLAMDAVSDQTESRLCSAFGVPPILIGCAIGLKRSTYANYREAKKSLWEETLIPTYTRIADALTMGLAMEFAGKNQQLLVSFDTAKIEALQESAQEKRTAGKDLYLAGIATKNEARELAGLPKVVGGDAFRVSMDDLGGGEDVEVETQNAPHADQGAGLELMADDYPVELHRRTAA